MDWLRTKVAFIIAFLALDLLLGWQWLQLNQILRPPTPQVQQAVPDNAVPSPSTLPPLVVVVHPFLETQAKALLTMPTCSVPAAGQYQCQGSIGPRLGSRLGLLLPPREALVLAWDAQAQVEIVASGVISARPQAVIESLAQGVIQGVDPGSGPYALQEPYPSPAVPGAAAAEYVETYQGNPIWDAFWEITVSQQGIVATRALWLDVLSHGASQSLVSPEAAIEAVQGAAGSNFQTAEVVLGYDVPQVPLGSVTPEGDFTLEPVYRVQVDLGSGSMSCYYVLAYSGEVATSAPGSQQPYRQPC